MKIFIKITIILMNLLGLVSCTPEMTGYFWNGHYSSAKITEELKRKKEEYYAKETLEQKKLRKENVLFCIKNAYSKIQGKDIWQDDKYISCMKNRGTPVFME